MFDLNGQILLPNGIGVSRQGAMDLLNPLLQAGLVSRIGTKKSGRYILS